MKLPQMRPHGSERGYSLLELMVVVAIIGVLSLVTIPSFVNFSRMQRIRGAIREVTSDLRYTRQVAITRSTPMTITFHMGKAPTDPDKRSRYDLPNTLPNAKRQKRLDRIVYFVGPENSSETVTFLPNGRVQDLAGSTIREIKLSSDYELPNDDVTITFQPSGSIKVKVE